eukprot:TRINITY_DN14169_c0_g3_i2.p4 TRINITY_DN14169_c0_g3~~TRINITY_DN14169_c0_g3_i2.p4  ORF type:complete len:130 (-),score=1.95 TRINITY_DN14169_c0_g3_i2:842-1231(-)
MLEDRFVKEYFNAYIYRKYTYHWQLQAPQEKETYFLGKKGEESPIHKTYIQLIYIKYLDGFHSYIIAYLVCFGLFTVKNYQNNFQHTNEICMHMVSLFSVRQEISPQNPPLHVIGNKQACTIHNTQILR